MINKLIICFVILASCTQKNEFNNEISFFTSADFEDSGIIELQKIKIDSLANPDYLLIIDSLLLITNYKTDYLLDIYNINTKQRINRLIRRGKGPNELIFLKEIQFDKESNHLMAFGSILQKVFLIDYNTLIDVNDFNDFKNFRVEKNNCARIVFYDPLEFVGVCYEDEPFNRLYFFNNKGEVVRSTGNYPEVVPKIGSMMDAQIFDTYMGLNENKEKLVLAYTNTDIIDIYDSKGDLMKRLMGPDKFIPQFKLVHINTNMTTVSFTSEQRNGYGRILPSDNSFYTLYSGLKMNEKGGYLFNQILEFDWNGKTLKRYKLSLPVVDAVFDRKHKKFYFLNSNNELYEGTH